MQRLDWALEWLVQIVVYAIFLFIVGALGFGLLVLAKRVAEWTWNL